MLMLSNKYILKFKIKLNISIYNLHTLNVKEDIDPDKQTFKFYITKSKIAQSLFFLLTYFINT